MEQRRFEIETGLLQNDIAAAEGVLAALTGDRFLTDGSFSFFTSQVLPLMLLILSSFAALLLSAFSAVLRSVRRHAAPRNVPAMQ